MTLSELVEWVEGVPDSLPEEMRPMAESICESFQSTARRLMDLGLGYLTLDRSAATLSTGERQRMQLARAVRNRTTGVLYVLDEPSIGLHPSNIVGLTGVMHDLVADGNSVMLVDHDTQILSEADWIVEMGPEAGAKGGHVIAAGHDRRDREEPRLPDRAVPLRARRRRRLRQLRRRGGAVCQRRASICPPTAIHTVKPLEVDIPQGAADRRHRRVRLRQDHAGAGKPRPRAGGAHRRQDAAGRTSARSMRRASRTSSSSTPRPSASTSAPPWPPTRASTTSCASSSRRPPDAKARGYKAGDFSYNTGAAALPRLRRNGRRQSGRAVPAGRGYPLPGLPRLALCPRGRRCAAARTRRGRRFSAGADGHGRQHRPGILHRPEKPVRQKLAGAPAAGAGLPHAGRGNAQSLRRRGAAAEAGQRDRAERRRIPFSCSTSRTIGLHPLDVQVLLGVFQALLDNGATVIVIEHDLDVIRNADYVIDMGPGGGDAGGRIVASRNAAGDPCRRKQHHRPVFIRTGYCST